MFVTWDREGRVRSESIQPFGAATTRPDSPHYNDQAPLFAQHKLKPVLFDPAALKSSGARFYRPSQPPLAVLNHLYSDARHPLLIRRSPSSTEERRVGQECVRTVRSKGV